MDVDHIGYLLLFSQTSARLICLTEVGHLTLCSNGEEVEPDHTSASSRITTHRGQVLIEALDGTPTPQVNDEPVDRPRQLVSGDVIMLGEARAIFNRDPSLRSDPPVLRASELRRRLVQEVDRALRYNRPLSVLTLQLDTGPGGLELACDLVTAGVRSVDIVGFNGSGEIVVILPETDEAAEVPARRLIDSVTQHTGESARIGIARCPGDGSDADALLTGSRLAVRQGLPGSVSHLSDEELLLDLGGQKVVAADPKTRGIFSLVGDLARSDLPVLITGETGVGKEVIARALHTWSPRGDGPLVCINCAAFSESLLESELFGHERGAFSGATSQKAGLLESASGGTVFLDELSESTPRVQVELLRVLETKRFRRVGAVQERDVDVRVVAATNRRIEEEVQSGRFRKDLYYRLNAATIEVPPLRDRILDLPPLARWMLAQACQRSGRTSMGITQEAMQRLLAHSWPGNVRELKNLMDKLEALVRGPLIEASDLPARVGPSRPHLREQPPQLDPAQPAQFRKLSQEILELERARMKQALTATGGVRIRAAELIGMPLRTFVTKLRVHGLSTQRSQVDATRAANH